MNTIIKKISLGLLLFVGSGFLFYGCQHSSTPTSSVLPTIPSSAQPTKADQSNVTKTVVLPSPKPNPVETNISVVTVVTNVISTPPVITLSPSSIDSDLFLFVQPLGTNEDETQLAMAISESVAGQTTTTGTKVLGVSNGADCILSVTPKLKTIDVAGEYFRIDCTVNLRLVSNEQNERILGTHSKEISGKRMLGKEAAINQFIKPSADEAAKWFDSRFKTVVQQTFGAEIISFQLPLNAEGKRSSTTDAMNIEKISNILSSMDGIVTYERDSQDFASGKCAFRIVFYKEKFKAGLINAIALKLQ